jgi:hypothetical protein
MIATFAIGMLMAAEPQAPDACRALIPMDLRQALARFYPQYLLPQATDQDAEKVKRYSSGTGCLGVATGDFDGDKRVDIALLLSGKERLRTRLVVALRGDDRWHLELIDTWVESITTQYIHHIAPGTYESGFEARKVTSPTDGFETGTIESTSHYFFRLKGRWTSLWMAD